MTKPEKKTLSKSILEMKFMKKSKEAAFKEAEDAEGRAMCGWSTMTHTNIVLEPSYGPCEALVAPRQSYHGANPEIESLAAELQQQKREVEEDVDVPAADVARVTHAGRKLLHQQPPRKRARFLKPKADDDEDD